MFRLLKTIIRHGIRKLRQMAVPFNSVYAHTKMGFDTSEITQVITIK